MLAINVPATSAIAVKIILKVVSIPDTICRSSSDANPRKPTLPGTSSKMPGTCVMIAGRSSKREYQLLAMDALNVPPDELKTAMRWRLKDMLDFHIDDATIDVLAIPLDKTTPARASHGMFAVAARNSVIEQRQNLFMAARLTLSVIDIPEMAQRNIATLIEPDGHAVAMLSFNGDGGLLTVTFKGELYLSRRIDIAQAQLMEPERELRDVSFDRITLELQRSFDHFDRQYHLIHVAKLVLAPNEAPELAGYLSSNLYMPVESLDLASVLDLSQVPHLATVEQQQRFFLTLGAALRLEETLL